MAYRKLTLADIPKRNNAELLCRRALSGKFQLSKDGAYVDGDKVVRLDQTEFDLDFKNVSQVAEVVKSFCSDTKNNSTKVSVKTVDGWCKLTDLHKDQEFTGQKKRTSGADGRKDQERQERGLVEIINSQTMNGPIKIPGVGMVKSAAKYDGTSSLGKEPYTDIILFDEKGKPLNVSCKDESAPSLGGGGLVGLKATVPEFIRAFFNAIESDMKKDGFDQGMVLHFKQIPDYFYQITSESFLKKIFVGTPAMGGPVDYMYIGPMDVSWNGTNFNGKFIPIQEYYRKYVFYLRLRKRDIHSSGLVEIDFKTKNKDGFPIIFKSGGKVASRILVDKTTYGNQARKL